MSIISLVLRAIVLIAIFVLVIPVMLIVNLIIMGPHNTSNFLRQVYGAGFRDEVPRRLEFGEEYHTDEPVSVAERVFSIALLMASIGYVVLLVRAIVRLFI